MKVICLLFTFSLYLMTAGDSSTELKECDRDDGEVGVCLKYYQCDSTDSAITDGEGIIVPRFGTSCDTLEYCCRKPEEEYQPGCGTSNPKGVDGDVFDGDKSEKQAKFGEFPWMIAIIRFDDGPKCGGSLIHPEAVLTAAHCAERDAEGNLPRMAVRAGEWDQSGQRLEERYPYQERNISGIRIHEQYHTKSKAYDIAILFLEEPFHLARHISVVCLPPQRNSPPKSRCMASGWGADIEVGNQDSNILKKVDLPIVDRTECLNSLRMSLLGPKFKLHKTFICAGGEAGKDTCKGDGGSPLVCPMPKYKNLYMQSGIVSWGLSCGVKGRPGMYTNVAMFRNWIEQKLSANDLYLFAYLPQERDLK